MGRTSYPTPLICTVTWCRLWKAGSSKQYMVSDRIMGRENTGMVIQKTGQGRGHSHTIYKTGRILCFCVNRPDLTEETQRM